MMSFVLSLNYTIYITIIRINLILQESKMFFNLFNKKSYDLLDLFYKDIKTEISESNLSWMALAINERTLKESFLTKEMVLYKTNKNKDSYSFQFAETKTGAFVNALQGTKKKFEGTVDFPIEEKKIRHNFNEVFDLYMNKEIKFFQEELNLGHFSPLQIEAEEKALEWLRVSFEVLSKAVVESFTNSDYLFQTKIFAGVNPTTNMREIRLITFNLDVTLLLLNDHNLRVIIYNRKPGVLDDKNLKPALIGDYSFRKREIFDKIVSLISLLSKGVHA